MRSFFLLFVLFLASCASPNVFVVRHAQAFKNLKPRPEVSAEKLDSLTELGQQQGKTAAALLAGRGVEIVLYSPTGRTRQTAEILASALGVPAQPMEELRSLRGAWDGREEAWARGEDPRPEDGESMADGVKRALAALRQRLGDNKVAAVVTHGDLAAGLIGEASYTPFGKRWGMHKPTTGSVTPVTLVLSSKAP